MRATMAAFAHMPAQSAAPSSPSKGGAASEKLIGHHRQRILIGRWRELPMKLLWGHIGEGASDLRPLLSIVQSARDTEIGQQHPPMTVWESWVNTFAGFTSRWTTPRHA